MSKAEEYAEFLKSKMITAPERGIEIDASAINPLLKPHQAAIVRWAVHKGNAAIFAAFGLGKTFMQLEIARLVCQHAGGKFLIVAPLGVRGEFKRDAEKLGIEIGFVRRFEECERDGIFLTNYETIRDSKMDPRKFTGCSLDEAAILRGFGGTKTFREFMRVFENGQVRYKFVATATPSPNEYIELLAYAAFLDVMDVSQAKTRFFKRDSTKADNLTLHAHKEREFWIWVSSWAIFLQKPSDLGFSDEGYALPETEIHWHELPSDHNDAGFETSGQGRLVRSTAVGVTPGTAHREIDGVARARPGRAPHHLARSGSRAPRHRKSNSRLCDGLWRTNSRGSRTDHREILRWLDRRGRRQTVNAWVRLQLPVPLCVGDLSRHRV